jgi:hypothetical protein
LSRRAAALYAVHAGFQSAVDDGLMEVESDMEIRRKGQGGAALFCFYYFNIFIKSSPSV